MRWLSALLMIGMSGCAVAQNGKPKHAGEQLWHVDCPKVYEYVYAKDRLGAIVASNCTVWEKAEWEHAKSLIAKQPKFAHLYWIHGRIVDIGDPLNALISSDLKGNL